MSIKDFVKKRKILLIAALALLAALCLVLFGLKLRENRIYENAQALYEAGDYAAALSEFERVEAFDEMADCEYQMEQLALEKRYAGAEALMAEGKYDEARSEFEALGDYEDASELTVECDYLKALDLYQQGQYHSAMLILGRIRHEKAPELYESSREALYQQAVQTAYENRMDEAIELFNQLGDYKDSEILKKRCSDRIVNMLVPISDPVIVNERSGKDVGEGVLYYHRMGLIYVPKDAGPDTQAMIFYPGGYDTALANNYMVEYVHGTYGSRPNAIMLFCYANGYGDMDSKIYEAYAALEQAALEHGIFLHDVSFIGASMGAYTACHSAVWFYENLGIKANYVVTLDAGQHWADGCKHLSPTDCDVAAKAGTKFVLVEGGGVGMNKLAIQTMVAHGVDVTIAHTSNYGHYQVIYDAMRHGIFTWVMGGSDRPEHHYYTYIPLEWDSTYPN